jgi:hypothetical protein
MGPDAGEDVMQQHHVLLLQSSAITELTTLYTQVHRVDRVPGLFSCRLNWDLPSPAGVCAPSPLVPGEGHTRFREMGVPFRTRGQTLWYSRYSIYVLSSQVARTMELTVVNGYQ